MRVNLVAILLLYALCRIPLLAQTAEGCTNSIQGKVYHLETKEPLAFASVQLDNTSQGTMSDETGYFEFSDLCEREYDLIFSFIGYKSITHHHDFHHPLVEIYLAPQDYLLESVVVEEEAGGSNLQTLTSVKLSSEELSSLATKTLGDAVSQITGVSTLRTGQNIVKPIIHGLHSNRVLIINNGLRHEFQNWGLDHAAEIDLSTVGELEVIKGAATVRFGPDALGGVILTNPRKMELSTPIRGHIRLLGRTNGRAGHGAFELSKGWKRLSLLGGGSYTKQGDLRAPHYYLTNTGKEEKSYYGGFRIHPFASLDIEGYYSRVDQTLGILSGSVFGNLEDIQRAVEVDTPLYTMPFSYDIDKPRQETQHDLYKATIRYVGKRHSIQAVYGHQINLRREFGVRRIDAPNIHLRLETQSLDLDWLHQADSIGISGRLGVQLLKKKNDNLPGTNTVPFIPNYDEKRLGVYLIESLDLGKHSVELGVRFDHIDTYIVGREPDNLIYRNTVVYNNFSGTVGLKTQFNDYATFQTNIGTAWRAPNVAELYRFGQHSFFLEYGLWRYTIDDRFDFITTSQGILTEEDRAVPSEVGYKWINTYTINRPNLRSEITGYINYVENFIYPKPGGITRSPKGYFVFNIYDQTDALLWGIDVHTEWSHNSALMSTFKGSYLWAKQTVDNDFFVGQPPPQLGYSLDYHPSIPFFDHSNFGISLSYTFEQFQHPRIMTVDEFLFAAQNGITRFEDDAPDFDILPPPPAYFLVDFSWSSSYKSLHWQFQVKNVFNTAYRVYTDHLRYFADDLGRNFILTLTYRF